jgi:hypothetical protein
LHASVERMVCKPKGLKVFPSAPKKAEGKTPGGNMKDLILHERPQVPAVIPKMTVIEETDFIHFEKRNFFREIIWKIRLRIILRRLKVLGVDVKQLKLGK